MKLRKTDIAVILFGIPIFLVVAYWAFQYAETGMMMDDIHPDSMEVGHVE